MKSGLNQGLVNWLSFTVLFEILFPCFLEMFFCSSKVASGLSHICKSHVSVNIRRLLLDDPLIAFTCLSKPELRLIPVPDVESACNSDSEHLLVAWVLLQQNLTIFECIRVCFEGFLFLTLLKP